MKHFFLIIMFFSFSEGFSQTIDEEKSIKIDLENGFSVEFVEEEDFGSFIVYSIFELCKDGEVIYTDNSLTEYEFGNELYPIVLKTGQNAFELLFEINDRPNKNYLKRLFIKNTQIVSEDKLPTFTSKPVDIDNDGIKEYVGFWDYAQTWGENGNWTTYNPILYYSVTETGLQLDSLLTRERNKNIYGEFYGFQFSEHVEIPASVMEKFEEEVNRIKNH